MRRKVAMGLRVCTLQLESVLIPPEASAMRDKWIERCRRTTTQILGGFRARLFREANSRSLGVSTNDEKLILLCGWGTRGSPLR